MRNITIVCNYDSYTQVPKCDIWVDGKIVENIKAGQEIVLSLDGNYHTVQCGYRRYDLKEVDKGALINFLPPEYKHSYEFSNKMEILSGNKDYKFFLKKKKVSWWDSFMGLRPIELLE